MTQQRITRTETPLPLGARDESGGGGSDQDPAGLCGDIPIRIDRDGIWHYRGSPITRKEMVCLFASVLRRTDDGAFWLITPTESGRITVEDAPFLAVELFHAGSGGEQVISFRTNVDEIVTVDAGHPLRIDHDPHSGEPRPYVTVRPGLDARLTRSVYYHVVGRGQEEETPEGLRYGVWSSGTFFPMGSLEDEIDGWTEA